MTDNQSCSIGFQVLKPFENFFAAFVIKRTGWLIQ